MNKPRKNKEVEQLKQSLAEAQTSNSRITHECAVAKADLYTVRNERTALYEKEYARRETLAALLGKFKQNVAEFMRVCEQVMEK